MRTTEIRNRSLNDWAAMGLDLRVVASAAVSKTTPRTEVGIAEAQIQLQAKLIPNRVSFYVDQTLGPAGADAREAFALVEQLPLNGYVKAGRFMLPYGWRLWDDAAYVRSETGFTYLLRDLGVEVGLEPGPLSVFLAVSNGNNSSAEDNDQKQVTSSAAFVHRNFRFGASASRNSGASSRREVFGGFGGFGIGPIAVLGEVDHIRDNPASATAPDDQLVAYVEGNLMPLKGLNAKVTYGYHDPDLGVSENQRIRMRFGVEAFPVSFVQLAAFYTLLDDVPQVTTDIDRVRFELHLHF